MGHQFKHKSETEHTRKPHQEVSEHDDLRAEASKASVAFSPATIMKLQRTIGNQAVMRLMGTKPTSSVQRAPQADDDMYAPLSADALLTRWDASIQLIEKEVNKEKMSVNDYRALAAHKALKPGKK